MSMASSRQRRHPGEYAVRHPGEYAVRHPGECRNPVRHPFLIKNCLIDWICILRSVDGTSMCHFSAYAGMTARFKGKPA